LEKALTKVSVDLDAERA
jgi:hypothetical protein